MEQFYKRLCKNCGGDLHSLDGGRYRCQYCNSIYETETVEAHDAEMRKLFDDFKLEAISNARKNLYDAVNAEYISSSLVHECAMALKQLIPDDFQANFYETAIGNDSRRIAKAIRRIDVDKNADHIETVIKFLLSSLEYEYLLETSVLIDRAYKNTDLTKYEAYSTLFSDEAKKIDDCVYMTSLSRDVFVAYSSADMDKVMELVDFLEDQGFSCFVAARNLRHGKGSVENYDEALREAMENCGTFVFVSSTNSRRPGCDALRKEIPYIKSVDIENAPPECRKDYATIPHRYKAHRIEYRIEESDGFRAADRTVDEFFDGFERVYSPEAVAERLINRSLYTEPTENKSEASDTAASVKYCVTCLSECPTDAKFCMNCAGNNFADTLNEAKLMQKIAEMQKEKDDLAHKAAENIQQDNEEQARRQRAAAEAERKAKEERERRQREEAERARQAQNQSSSTPSSVKVGDYIKFGKYKQDARLNIYKEDLEWLVLEINNGRALVISKYGIDCQPYNQKCTKVTWENCSLRNWLNNEFINNAFSPSEIAKIPTVTVPADKNPAHNTDQGYSTQDKIFLLSIAEAKKYFLDSNSARVCQPTDHAVSHGAYKHMFKKNCEWWLRTSGFNQKTAATVTFSGIISENGLYVNAINFTVRPAMWVELGSDASSNGTSFGGSSFGGSSFGGTSFGGTGFGGSSYTANTNSSRQFTLAFIRESQWFLVNPAMNINIKGNGEDINISLENGKTQNVILPEGKYHIQISSSFRKFDTDLNLYADTAYKLSWNRISGNIQCERI